MKYLLDSHTLLWILETPARLPNRTRQIVEDPGSGLLVSIATPWELAIKTNSGKLNAAKILKEFDHSILSAGYDLLETKVSHVVRAGMLPLHHRDPFDRLMIAQALELGIPIVSRDPVFDLYGVKRIWN
ncbi:MAG TPA: type II toxin-antitoxin system VapC family toxin [Terracidiphilus sp.]|nr:type II toxin-antitoxin system VapC family toxin [Terracidiphilus sp.]